MKAVFEPLFRLNGRFKWAMFIAFILSAAFTYVFFFSHNNYASRQDVIKNRIIFLENDLEIRRQWRLLEPRVSIDTMKIVRQLDSLRRLMEGNDPKTVSP